MVNDAQRVPRLRPGWDRCLGIAGIVLLAIHGLVVLSLAVDVPHAEEWGLLGVGALDQRLNFGWLWRPHNEHRMVFTKLIAWILYRSGNLHLPTQAAVNFLGYVGLCGLLVSFMHRNSDARGSFLWIPLSSVLLWEIHYWSFQSHFHVYILFFVAALAALRSKTHWKYMAAPCAACSAYAFASGVVCAAGVATAALWMAWSRPTQRWGYISQAIVIALAIACWFLPSPPASPHSFHAWPWSSAFWIHLGSTWARGFGFNQLSPWGVGLGIIAAGLLLGFGQHKRLSRASTDTREAWTMAFIFGLTMLSCTLLVSFGRGNVPNMTRYIAPRYLENVLLTLPLLWALVWQSTPKSGALRLAAGVALLVPFADELNARHTYTKHHAELVTLRACTDAYYRGENNGFCPTELLFEGGHLGEVLDRAKTLGLSFTEVGEQSKNARLAASPSTD